MSNLIDRESAVCALMSLIVPLEEYHDFNHGINDACVEIMKLPSAEPEIIYCKNCKYCDTNISPDGNEIYWICKYWDGGTDADGFCHNAERRTNE